MPAAAVTVNPPDQQHLDLILSCPPGGQSGDLLAGVATLALKGRLARHEGVETNVQCSLTELLQGRVQQVQIIGRGW